MKEQSGYVRDENVERLRLSPDGEEAAEYESKRTGKERGRHVGESGLEYARVSQCVLEDRLLDSSKD